MQSPPFGILRINNNNLHHTGNPPPKQGQQQQAGQLAPIPVTNHTIGLADARRGRSRRARRRKTKFWRCQESKSFTGDSHTLLITPMNLMPHFHPEPMMLTMMTYSWTLHKLHEMKQKTRERKERLWQLLSQRSSVPATPTILVVAAPFFSVPFVTSYHRIPPFSSRSGYRTPPRKRRQVKNLKLITWWI